MNYRYLFNVTKRKDIPAGLFALLTLFLTACSLSSNLVSDPATKPTAVQSSVGPCDLQHASYTIRRLAFREYNLNNGWAPGTSSSRIAFADSADGRIKVYDTKTDGIENILTPSIDASSPEWASDGRIFFSSLYAAPTSGQSIATPNFHNPPGLFVMGSDGQNLQSISISNDFPSGPNVLYWDRLTPIKLSPNGRLAAFNVIQGNRWTILLGNLEWVNGKLSLEYTRQLDPPGPYWNAAEYFTRDSQQLIFVSSRDDSSGKAHLSPDIYTLDLQTNKVTRYTHNPAWNETMDISTIDDFVIFSSDRAHPTFNQQPFAPVNSVPSDAAIQQFIQFLIFGTLPSDLYLAGAQGDYSWVRRLTTDGDSSKGSWDSSQPRWSPDGLSIRFQQGSGNGTNTPDRTLLLTFKC